jgi:uncharacterized coiled-coil DUF342 family protein
MSKDARDRDQQTYFSRPKDIVMKDRLQELEQKRHELDAAISETRKRLPAHSVKPPVMMDLLELEDQYDEILKQLRAIKENRNEAL